MNDFFSIDIGIYLSAHRSLILRQFLFRMQYHYYCQNLNIEKCIFPDKFKMAIVVLLYKSGVHKYVNNDRTISMLNNFSKILEKIIKNRLSIDFLEKTNLKYKENLFYDF